MDIRHEPERRRFVAEIEGSEAVLDYVEHGAHVLDFRHTFTPTPLRGQGIARDLVLFALDYARSHGFKVIPTCPYVGKVLRENPAYESLVARSH